MCVKRLEGHKFEASLGYRASLKQFALHTWQDPVSINKANAGRWWSMCLTPPHTMGRQRQAGLCEFKASVVYTASFSTAGLHRETLS